jgi:hypothetical protein
LLHTIFSDPPTGTRAGYLAAVQVTPGDERNPTTLQFDLMWAEPPGHLRDTSGTDPGRHGRLCLAAPGSRA